MSEEPKPRGADEMVKGAAPDNSYPAWLTEGAPAPQAAVTGEPPKPPHSRWAKVVPLFGLFGGLVALSALVLQFPFTKHGNESQVRSAELAALPLVPNLEAKLVVEDVSVGQFTFRFDLKNIGKLRARNIGYLYSMPRGLTLGSAADAKHPRDLAPDSSMSLRPEDRRQPLPAPGGAPLKLHFVLTYSAVLEGKDTWYRRKMVFAVYPDVKVGPVSMEEGVDTNETLGLGREIAAVDLSPVLNGSHGSASVDFDVADQKTDRATVFFSSNVLALVFDPGSTTMVFQILKAGAPSILMLQCRLNEPRTERHHVSISWDEYGAALRCDGVEINGSRLPP